MSNLDFWRNNWNPMKESLALNASSMINFDFNIGNFFKYEE
jgi:hypothetical protein